MRRFAFFCLPFCLALSGPLRADPIADPIPVRYPQGTSHGFLVLRAMDGKTIAVGDSVQTVHGKRVTSRMTFRFHDGSIDDETAEFTQTGVFRLLHDHHIQRGPAFPKPMDMSIDVPSSTVITREETKGKAPKTKSQQMDMPPDLANGMVLTLLLNIDDQAPKTTLSYVADFNGARLIHISVTPQGIVPFRVGGMHRQAREFIAKAELGGITGVIAPVIGKQPKDYRFFILEGEAPAFVWEQGQLYTDGPVWTIEQAGPTIR